MPWEERIGVYMRKKRFVRTACHFRQRYENSESKPVILLCDDGREYYVKGRQPLYEHMDRVLVNDHIVGWLGALLMAPVGQVTLIDLSAELLSQHCELSEILPGLSHGTLAIPNCSERAWIEYTHVGLNRPRFAKLAVLYGWVHSHDEQFIYHLTEPHLVYSVDHGNYFYGGPPWTIESLQAAPPATLCEAITRQLQFTEAEVETALSSLRAITDEQIAFAVATPPAEWNISMTERVALATYLAKRRRQMLQE